MGPGSELPPVPVVCPKEQTLQSARNKQREVICMPVRKQVTGSARKNKTAKKAVGQNGTDDPQGQLREAVSLLNVYESSSAGTVSLKEFMQAITDSVMHYGTAPGMYQCRITYNDLGVTSAHFSEDAVIYSADLRIDEEKRGEIDISLLKTTAAAGAAGIPAEVKEFLSTITALAARLIGHYLIQIDSREQAERFISVFENSPLGKSITGVDGSLQVNKRFCSILGYESKDLLCKKWKEITHPDDVEESTRIIQSLIAGEHDAARFEKRYLHRDGHVVWAEVNTVLQRDADGNPMYFITTIEDIGEKKEMHARLARSEQRLRMLLDNLPYGTAIIGDDKTVRSLNKTALNMLGYSELDQVVERPCHTVFCPADADECPIFDLGQTLDRSERVVVRKDGSRVPVLKSAVPLTIEGELLLVETFIDISEQKKMDDALKSKVAELNRFNTLAIGREKRMIELKEKINELSKRLGDDPPYIIPGLGDGQ